jgi:hypothetical protein
MASVSSASTDARRAAAQHARLERSRRIARLRRRVLAAALATFALAFGVIAFDGSMGSTAAKSSAASGSGSAAATSSAQTAQDDPSASDDGVTTGTSDDTGSASSSSGGGSTSDTLTTSQS